MANAYAIELANSLGGGMASLPETFRLTKTYTALVTYANPDRAPIRLPERQNPEDSGRSGLV